MGEHDAARRLPGRDQTHKPRPQVELAMAGVADGTLLRAFAVVAGALLAALGAAYLLRGPRPVSGETRLRALDHVEELRRRLVVCIAAWLVVTLAAFSFRIGTWRGFPVPIPALRDNFAAQAFHAIAEHAVPDNVTLVVTRPFDAFVAELSIAAAIGFVVVLPIAFGQLAAYVGPALRPAERRMLLRAIVPATALFLAGAAFAWFLVLPLLLRTLYEYAASLGAEPLLVVADLISFTLTTLVMFGLAFQLPLVMAVLARAGIVEASTFASKWRHAVVAIVIVSAFATDPTVISQLMMAGPLLVLYGLGIVAARAAGRARRRAA